MVSRRQLFALAAGLFLLAGTAAAAEPKKEVVIQPLQFGTAAYAEAQAIETVFSEMSSLISVKAQETPGAMYIVRYAAENREAMKNGTLMPPMTATSPPMMPSMLNGLPPFQDYPVPEFRILFGTGYTLYLFVSFDENIKSPHDFTGKRVGFAEKSRPFISFLPNEWLFSGGYKNWDKVDWQYLGTSNSKDALLNNRLDVHWASFRGDIEMDADGRPFVSRVSLSPDMMEITNAGRRVSYVSEDPAVWESAPKKLGDVVYMPVRIPAGTLPGQERDVWGRFGSSVFMAPSYMPDDVVAELVRLRVEGVSRLQNYHDLFKMYPPDPYPRDADLSLMHPAALEAMKKLGFDVPESK